MNQSIDSEEENTGGVVGTSDLRVEAKLPSGGRSPTRSKNPDRSGNGLGTSFEKREPGHSRSEWSGTVCRPNIDWSRPLHGAIYPCGVRPEYPFLRSHTSPELSPAVPDLRVTTLQNNPPIYPNSIFSGGVVQTASDLRKPPHENDHQDVNVLKISIGENNQAISQCGSPVFDDIADGIQELSLQDSVRNISHTQFQTSNVSQSSDAHQSLDSNMTTDDFQRYQDDQMHAILPDHLLREVPLDYADTSSYDIADEDSVVDPWSWGFVRSNFDPSEIIMLEKSHLTMIGDFLCGVASMKIKFVDRLDIPELIIFQNNFGPLDTSLQYIQQLYDDPKFHRFISRDDASRILEESAEGSYLFRFSESCLHLGGISCSVIVRVSDPEPRLCMQEFLMFFDANSRKYTFDGMSFASLQDFAINRRDLFIYPILMHTKTSY